MQVISYFRIVEPSVYSRFNWYVNGADWKPLHHDTAAFSQRRLGKQNITVPETQKVCKVFAFVYGALRLLEPKEARKGGTAEVLTL